MVELILVRHAKSDWGVPGLDDHERPLNGRGERDAPLMAERLAQTSVEVERIVSSTAVRARTTAGVFGVELGVEVELDPELYAAPGSTLLAKAVATGAGSVMVVAHNPGISDLAARFSGGGIEHMPTCAVARFEWDARGWDEVGGRVADRWGLDTPR
ncbi:SixA phosphatase family protein [Leucobacter triazinivorans]|uniref:Phosphohistidine phosphatase n=1 Tax=Leucobacter triazinivorans TaxID=1784719 RepID=A0A4P6KHP9_9MICO|nr:histidine phosphatase family protein [Leucobacter triazinivorans]QBE49830.1 phosphohistidine phosphatase [Leucobacter triazinivorans]